MGDAKLKTNCICFGTRGKHSQSYGAFSSIVTPSEFSQNVQQSLKLCGDSTIKRGFNTQSCTAGKICLSVCVAS